MTDDVVEKIAEALTDHSWTSTTPKEVIEGPIPNVLDYPVIGVMSPDGEIDDNDLDNLLMTDIIEVTFGMPITLGERKEAFSQLSAMALETVNMATNAPSWGYSAIQSTTPMKWATSFGAFEEDMDEDDSFWMYLTVQFEIRHKVALI